MKTDFKEAFHMTEMADSIPPYVLTSLMEAEGRRVCLTVSAARPDEFMDALREEVRQLAYDGEIFLDLLACNGLSFNRFFVIHCVKGEWDSRKMIRLDPEKVPEELRVACNLFYARHPMILHQSVLSERECFKMMRHYGVGDLKKVAQAQFDGDES